MLYENNSFCLLQNLLYMDIISIYLHFSYYHNILAFKNHVIFKNILFKEKKL
jgi:hypothetical protein